MKLWSDLNFSTAHKISNQYGPDWTTRGKAEKSLEIIKVAHGTRITTSNTLCTSISNIPTIQEFLNKKSSIEALQIFKHGKVNNLHKNMSF